MERTQRHSVVSRPKSILIYGSGIAGPTLAYWLAEGGFEPTLMERAPRYERIFRPFIERKQRAARSFAASFAPRTTLGLTVRDLAVSLVNVPLLGGWMTRRLFADEFALPESPGSRVLRSSSGRAEVSARA